MTQTVQSPSGAAVFLEEKGSQNDDRSPQLPLSHHENSLYFVMILCFRLWHQLTLKLERFVKHESLQKGNNLLQLYNNFIHAFENK